MSESSSLDSLPKNNWKKIVTSTWNCLASYRRASSHALIHRRALTLRLLTMQKELRRHCMYLDCLDAKTSPLFLFAILLTNLQDAVNALRKLDAEEFAGLDTPSFL